ncbi:hypothetical protein GCM10025858_21570 [Alicyclobacillus sacchari]|nr:hypothetical protein GCM10025858_21570 [Alicyclobacillus sacchari]
MSLGSPNTDLTYNQIPKNVQDAIVATEDHTFWTNSGIDIRSIFRSLFVDLSSGSLAQGASTIPEQLAKITYLTDQKTFSRKFKQIALGLQIERNFTKQEILAMYLNRIPLGESSIGIEQAALRYFGIDLKKEPDKLTLADAALLACLKLRVHTIRCSIQRPLWNGATKFCRTWCTTVTSRRRRQRRRPSSRSGYRFTRSQAMAGAAIRF